MTYKPTPPHKKPRESAKKHHEPAKNCCSLYKCPTPSHESLKINPCLSRKSRPKMSPALRWLFILQCYATFCPSFAHRESARIKVLQNLIRNVVGNDDPHPSVWLKNCWSTTENLEFFKSITNHTYKRLQGALEADVDWNGRRYYQNVWFAVDMECDASEEFVRKTNESYFGHPFRWILIDGNAAIWDRLRLFMDSNVIFAHFEEAADRYSLRQGKFFSFFFLFHGDNAIFAHLPQDCPKKIALFPGKFHSLPTWHGQAANIRAFWVVEHGRWLARWPRNANSIEAPSKPTRPGADCTRSVCDARRREFHRP